MVNESFESISLAELNDADAASLDALPFGVIGLMPDSTVRRYNLAESKTAGLGAARVIGRRFFEEIAPCMNNFMVAQRFEDEAHIDDIIPYVLTLRMRPTPVRLRLLKAPGHDLRFMLVERKVTGD
ncbi:MAG: phosphonate transporter [Janthinobacterium lividum]